MEEWKEIERFNGKFSISNYGRVRNNTTNKFEIGKIRNESKNVIVRKIIDKKQYIINIPREVLVNFSNEFNPNKNNFYHIDGDRRNNHIENLSFNRNRYVERDNYIVGYTAKEEEFLIDKEDLENVKNYTWYKRSDNYIMCSCFESRGNNKYLHKHIMNINSDVDHINRDRTDNRKQNLRQCTIEENNRNQSIRISNTSGIIGVIKGNVTKKYGQTWRAQIKYNNELIRLGTFHDIEDAIKARLKAEKKYFKEFAPQTHLFKEYGI